MLNHSATQQLLIPNPPIAPQFSANQPTQSTMTSAGFAISLVKVARHYNPIESVHQMTAIDWLQNQLPTPTVLEFFQRWHNTWKRQLPQLQRGNSGEVVAELQQHLNRWGANIAVDGIFGARTQAAVLNFQKRRILVMDGIVGARTWNEVVKSAQTIRLSQLLRSYSPSLHPSQQQALEWLQLQVRTIVLAEFAKRWRKQL